MKSVLDRIRGCLLGGAIGDALGAAVEFNSLTEIHRRYGTSGIRDFAPAYGRIGAITDDTQMTLFTAEGLIRAKNRLHERGTTMPVTILHRAYLRWLQTQGVAPLTSGWGDLGIDLHPGWLSEVNALHSRRAPGNSCLTALRKARGGTIDSPINDSKGCGGVMRVAPIGLAFSDQNYAFDLACEAAAITHGHPTGYLTAGVFAAIISNVIRNGELRPAIVDAIAILRTHPNSSETEHALITALDAAEAQTPSAETVERIGQGWIAEEALAIALYCVLIAPNLEEAVIIAVNHSGDSDSTGAIAGNIAGAISGAAGLPNRWLRQLELREVIEKICEDLNDHFHRADFEPDQQDLVHYPPN